MKKHEGAGVALRDGKVEEHYEVRLKSPYGDNVLYGKDLSMLDKFWKENDYVMKKSEVFIVHVKTRVIKFWDPNAEEWKNPREKSDG